MTWAMPAQFRGRYDDLIFCPLDLPKPPEVLVEDFVRWMKVGQDAQRIAPKLAFERVEKRTYPWLMRTMTDDFAPLAEAFPDVSQYLSVFPFRKLRSVVILAQQGHQAVHTHTDSDGLYGMRFYLTAKNAEGLHFFKGRSRYDRCDNYKRSPTGELVRADWDALFDTGNPVFASLPEETRAFMLNNARAAHAVSPNTCELGERIAVLVQGELDEARRDALLERSLKRFGQNAIWY